MSIWSVGDHGVSNIDGEFDEEPQLLCDSQHEGDVLDLQVSVKTLLLIRYIVCMHCKYVQCFVSRLPFTTRVVLHP